MVTPQESMLMFHRSMRMIVLLLLTTGVAALAVETTAPVIPGLSQKHPLNETQQGALLMAELRCAACHDGLDRVEMKIAPDLREVGARLTFEGMQQFIANPAAFHAGTTMPQMLAAEDEEKRREISTAISHYLLSLSKSAVDTQPLPDEAHDGFERFHSLGCVACHPPRDQAGKEIAPGGFVSLAHVSKKYQPRALASFLYEPLKVRPGGRMPDMNLNSYDAEVLAAYLMAGKTANAEAKASPQQVEKGERYFRTYNCVACHQVGDDFKTPLPDAAPSRKAMRLDQGCLSEASQKAPHFALNEPQRRAIRAALQVEKSDASTADRINMRLTQLNCIACHQRDDYGGVAASRDAFFHSKEEALGNESRIPPPLTGVGGKLRADWLNRVLYDRERARPYMITRMPHYGEVALRDLAGWLVEQDRMKPLILPEPDNEKRNQLRDAGLQLLGDQGLNCIACHNYNGTESPGMKGIDLMTSYQRLTPEWFFAYMKNPATYRPGIIMPSYWPQGKALQTEILEGDTEQQLQALWYTFSLGRSARDPSGLKQSDIRLKVNDRAVIHRGRSRVAGYRGIAVGLGDINYAFNAQNGSLAAIWRGDFVTVNWKSQGAGDFHPIGKFVSLPQDVSFLPQASAPASWPLLPQTTKEAPVNPDPTYPRAHGFAFGGYALDGSDIPTFRYRSGEVMITDVMTAHPPILSSAPSSTLRRTLMFSTEKDTSLVFRILTGAITSPAPGIYQTKELAVGISNPLQSAQLRPFAQRDGEQELLLPLHLKKGTTTLTLEYALLP